MRRRILAAVARMRERQKKHVRHSVLGIAAAAAFCNADKAECFRFPNCGRNGGTVHPILDEIVCGYWKAAIVFAAMVGEFDFETRNHHVRCAGQNPVGR
jgi:hypothetical protein